MHRRLRRYGYYECDECGREWRSAYTWCKLGSYGSEWYEPVDAQDCRDCRRPVFAYSTRRLLPPKSRQIRKSHDKALCHRCRNTPYSCSDWSCIPEVETKPVTIISRNQGDEDDDYSEDDDLLSTLSSNQKSETASECRKLMNESLIKPQSPVVLQQRKKRKRKWNEIDSGDDNGSVLKELFSIHRPASKRMKMLKTESTEDQIKRISSSHGWIFTETKTFPSYSELKFSKRLRKLSIYIKKSGKLSYYVLETNLPKNRNFSVDLLDEKLRFIDNSIFN